MIKTTTVFIVLALAAVASAQLIYDAVRIPVPAGTTCPTSWTLQAETVTVEARFYILAPAILGGRVFPVSENLVDRLWPTDAAQAAAVVSGVLEVQAEFSSTKNYCSLLPKPRGENTPWKNPTPI